MNKLYWAVDKPVMPGWYWYKNNNAIMVCCVYEANNGLFFEYATGELLPVRFAAGEWAGPLKPPKVQP